MMDSTSLSYKVESIFNELRILDSDQIFHYEKFDSETFFFRTKDFQIMYGFTAWLKYIFEPDNMYCIYLNKKKNNPSGVYTICVKVTKHTYEWTIRELEPNVYLLTESPCEETVSDYYPTDDKDMIHLPYEYEFFSNEYASMALFSNTEVSSKIRIRPTCEVLAESEFVYLLMDPKTFDFEAYPQAKPYLSNVNGINAFTVTICSELSNIDYYSHPNQYFVDPFFAKIDIKDFEELLSLSEKDCNLQLIVFTNSFRITTYASDVYKCLSRKREKLEYYNTKTWDKDFQKEKQIIDKENRSIFWKKFNKRVTPFLLIILTIVIICFFTRTPFVASQESYPDRYGRIEKYRGYSKDVKIHNSSTLAKHFSSVPSIVGTNAFNNNTKITSFTCTAQVITIEPYAFADCTNLSKVILESPLLRIEDNAFENCPIQEITIPPTVYFIGNNVFKGTNLKKISVGKQVFEKCPQSFEEFINRDDVEITFTDDSAAFNPQTYLSYSGYNNNELIGIYSPFEEVTIPESVIYIDLKQGGPHVHSDEYDFTPSDGGWLYRSNVTKINLPSQLKGIGVQSFQNTNLTSIYIPDSVTYIDSNAFYYSKITEVRLPAGIDRISFCAFDHTLLKEVTIPGNVKDINYRAFGNCSELETVIIENGIEDIDEYAFANCENLTTVKIGKTIKNIDSTAFSGCTNLKEVLFTDGDKVIDSYVIPEGKSVVRIPYSILDLNETQGDDYYDDYWY